MRRLAPTLAFVAVLVPRAVHAEPAVPVAHLDYARGLGAETCPDEGEIRASVAQRLGRDPFGDGGPTVRVVVTRAANAYEARIDLLGADGSLRGSRSLSSEASRCGDLATALVVSVSVAIDPATLTALSTPSPAAAEARDSSTQASSPSPSGEIAPTSEKGAFEPAPKDDAALRYDATVAMGCAVASAPDAALAVLAGLGVKKRFASLGVEGRFDLPSSARAAGGTVTASSVRANLVPCLHVGWLRGCAIGAIGSLHGRGEDVTNPISTTSLLLAAGARGLVVVPVSKAFDLRAGADVLATIRGTRLILDGREAWASPAVSALFWAGGGANFP